MAGRHCFWLPIDQSTPFSHFACRYVCVHFYSIKADIHFIYSY